MLLGGAIVSNQAIIGTASTNIVTDNTNVETNTNMQNSIQQDNYFAETKLERDNMFSEMLETYQKMIESNEVPADQKTIATQEITNITNIKNGTMIAENLIKNKDFEDVVILVNNGIVTVVVKSAILSQEQIAKIQNIVSRELNVEVSQIHITNKN